MSKEMLLAMIIIIIIESYFVNCNISLKTIKKQFLLFDGKDIMNVYRQYLIDEKKDIGRLNDFERLLVFSVNYNSIIDHDKSTNKNYKMKINFMADLFANEKLSLFGELNLNNNTDIIEDKMISFQEIQWKTKDTEESINWATERNPLGYPIVSYVKNQVRTTILYNNNIITTYYYY